VAIISGKEVVRILGTRKRAETGGPAAKKALRRERARIWKIVFEVAGEE
jgi:hypothetical protein